MFKKNFKHEIDRQRSYYKLTAGQYDQIHSYEIDNEHGIAFSWMISLIDMFKIKSILDIGSGTGKHLKKLIDLKPDIKIIGIEPSPELREIGYKNYLKRELLIDGDAMSLNFDDCQFLVQ